MASIHIQHASVSAFRALSTPHTGRDEEYVLERVHVSGPGREQLTQTLEQVA